MRKYRACGGISSEWSYVTAYPSHYGRAVPVLSPVIFMHVGHPYTPFFILLASLPFGFSCRIVMHYIHILYHTPHYLIQPHGMIK